jgi:hypothetical protein
LARPALLELVREAAQGSDEVGMLRPQQLGYVARSDARSTRAMTAISLRNVSSGTAVGHREEPTVDWLDRGEPLLGFEDLSRWDQRGAGHPSRIS